MDTRLKYYLYKSVVESHNTALLEQLGYDFFEITSAISDLIHERLIVINNDYEYEITDLGEADYINCREKYIKSNRKGIEPYVKYRIEKMSKYDIFLE